MPVYSFRAECPYDIIEFAKDLTTRQIGIVDFSVRPIDGDVRYPDRKVECVLDTDLATVQRVLRSLPDSHVMLQTLHPCPLAENSLERNYQLR